MIAAVPGPMLITMGEDRYHALPRLSRSQFCDFLTSPQLYYFRHVKKDPHWQQKATDAMDFGTACHNAILIDRDAQQAFQVIPDEVLTTDGKKAGNKFKEWAAANPGKHHLKAKEAEAWLNMWDAIRFCDDASRLLLETHEGSQEEVTALWTHNGIDLRCRLDRVIPGIGIVDLKTCAKGDLNSIECELVRRKLDIQAAWYRMAIEKTTGEVMPFTFVFQEKVAPYRTVCVQIDSEWLGLAEAKILAGLDRLQRCADAGDWEDPISVGVHVLKRPKFADYIFETTGD